MPGAAAVDGIAVIDRFVLNGAGGAAVRLASDLVSQSGRSSVVVDANGSDDIVVDGRGTGTIQYQGRTGADLIIAGRGADTIEGLTAGDTVVGGDGGDRITLGGGGSADSYAVIVSEFDGTGDINGVVTNSTAGTVLNTDVDGNDYCSGVAGARAEWRHHLLLYAGADVTFGWGASVLSTSSEIAGNAVGSLTAVRNAVGARMGAGTIGERIILVIGGANEAQVGVYLFEDVDNNATIDVADTLRLLAIGEGDVPTFNSGKGFRLLEQDLF